MLKDSEDITQAYDEPHIMLGPVTQQTHFPEAIKITEPANSDAYDTRVVPDITIVISNVPEGASLSAGIKNNNSSYTLTLAQLKDLQITPPTHTDVDFDLTVTTISTIGDKTTIKTGSLYVNVDAFSDTLSSPELPKIKNSPKKHYGGAGRGKIFSKEENDSFIFGTNKNNDRTTDAGFNAWIFTVCLNNIKQAPSKNLQDEGSWTLEVDENASYTVDNDNDCIIFDDGNAGGTIHLNNGGQVDFLNIDKIEW